MSTPATLDVLGLGAVLALAGEPVAPTLEEVARFDTQSQGEVRLLRNPTAWPGAAFVDEAVFTMSMTPLENCDVAGVLCLDFSPVAAAFQEAVHEVTRVHGGLRVQFRADDVPRQLLVSEMHRRQWQAWAGTDDLRVARVTEGLIGVDVPAGVGAIQLSYRPTLIIWMVRISAAVLLLATLTLLVGWQRRRGASA